MNRIPEHKRYRRFSCKCCYRKRVERWLKWKRRNERGQDTAEE